MAYLKRGRWLERAARNERPCQAPVTLLEASYPILIMPMPSEREKLVREIDGLKERIRLAWLDMITKPMAPRDRQELRESIESLIRELENLRTRLDQPPKAEA